MTYRSISIAEAVRVHTREEQARSKYRLARSRYLEHWYGGDPFREALVARARWTALAEIIEAAERSERRVA